MNNLNWIKMTAHCVKPHSASSSLVGARQLVSITEWQWLEQTGGQRSSHLTPGQVTDGLLGCCWKLRPPNSWLSVTDRKMLPHCHLPAAISRIFPHKEPTHPLDKHKIFGLNWVIVLNSILIVLPLTELKFLFIKFLYLNLI